MSDGCGTTEPESNKEIRIVLKTLSARVATVNSLVKDLKQRLAPIMLQEPPPTEEDNAKSTNTEIGTQIDSCNNSLQESITRCEAMFDLLQI